MMTVHVAITITGRGWIDEPEGTSVLSRFFWIASLATRAQFGWPSASIQFKESHDEGERQLD